MKKTIITLAIVIVAGLTYLAIRFDWFENEVEDLAPELILSELHVENLTDKQARMRAIALIDNPTPVGLHIDSLAYRIFIEGALVVEDAYPSPLDVEGNDTAQISLPVSVWHDRLASVVERLDESGQDSALYVIDATLYTDAAPGGSFTIKIEERLPLVTLPRVEVTGIDVEEPGVDDLKLVVHVLVKNDNVFSFAFEGLSYQFRIGENEPIEGNDDQKVRLPARGEDSISIPVRVNLGEAAKSAVDLIAEGGDLSYRLELSTTLISGQAMLDDSQMTLTASGTLGDLSAD